jgi:hypothetical protein
VTTEEHIIGVDPHKASHTAVAIGDDERELTSIRVRATRRQVGQLLAWAEPLGVRTWAIESAGGLGYLLGQQLVASGESVLDVPATLASRVRVLASGRSNKNDPNDALSVAVAALRAPALRPVQIADHAEVLRLSGSSVELSRAPGGERHDPRARLGAARQADRLRSQINVIRFDCRNLSCRRARLSQRPSRRRARLPAARERSPTTQRDLVVRQCAAGQRRPPRQRQVTRRVPGD